jgi:ADP-ribose pyrophosphatase YjhB (NUDIX family)
VSETGSSKPNPDFVGNISAVVALVRDTDGKVLLSSFSESGPWSCLGGGVSRGESLATAAVKLAREDCGLLVEVGDLVAELSGDKYRVLYECGADTTYLATVYAAKLLDDSDSAPAPMLVRWFAPAELAGVDLDEFATVALADLGLLQADIG